MSSECIIRSLRVEGKFSRDQIRQKRIVEEGWWRYEIAKQKIAKNVRKMQKNILKVRNLSQK